MKFKAADAFHNVRNTRQITLLNVLRSISKWCIIQRMVSLPNFLQNWSLFFTIERERMKRLPSKRNCLRQVSVQRCIKNKNCSCAQFIIDPDKLLKSSQISQVLFKSDLQWCDFTWTPNNCPKIVGPLPFSETKLSNKLKEMSDVSSARRSLSALSWIDT